MSSDLRDHIRYESRDGKAYITIDRPEKRNALAFEMLDELVRYVDQAEQDDDVRVILLKGGGKQDFCAGHDLEQVSGRYGFDDAQGRRPSQRIRLHTDKRDLEKFQRIFYCVKPIIALVRGNCMGAGLHLVEASDLAIASDTARIGHPEQKIGLSGAAYMTTLDILTMGPKKAREMLLLAEVMSAEQAAALGLVNKVVPDAELETAGEEWADRIVKLPRDGIAIGKAATHLAMDSLGMSTQFIHGYITHVLGTNIRFEPDEFNFLKNRRDHGVRAASHAREGFYDKKRGK